MTCDSAPVTDIDIPAAMAGAFLTFLTMAGAFLDGRPYGEEVCAK